MEGGNTETVMVHGECFQGKTMLKRWMTHRGQTQKTARQDSRLICRQVQEGNIQYFSRDVCGIFSSQKIALSKGNLYKYICSKVRHKKCPENICTVPLKLSSIDRAYRTQICTVLVNFVLNVWDKSLLLATAEKWWETESNICKTKSNMCKLKVQN